MLLLATVTNRWVHHIHSFLHTKNRIMPLCHNEIFGVLLCCFNCLCYIPQKLSLDCVRLWLCQQCLLYCSVIHSIYQALLRYVFQCCILATKLSYLSKFCNEFGYASSLLLVSHVEYTMLNYHQRFGTVIAARVFNNVFICTFFWFF